MYMAIKHLGDIAAKLIEGGRDPGEPVAVVSNATLPDMHVLETTLSRAAADIAAKHIEPPAIVCVGRVVQLRQALDWLGQSRGEPIRALDPLGVRPSQEAS